MTTLLRVEWLKMKKYNFFWWIMAITALSYPGINYIFYKGYEEMTSQPSQASQLAKLAIGNPFTFPEVWHTVAFFSSCFVFIPAVAVIMFATNEYTFKTHRQNIIDGWSRSQFISSKLTDVFLITLFITMLYVIVCAVTGYVNYTWHTNDIWSLSYYTGLFALQTFAQLSIAFLIGFLVKKAFIALGIFIFYFFPFEPIIVGVLKHYAHDAGKYMPLEISDRILPIPAFLGKIDKESYDKSLAAMPEHIILTVILTAIVWLICYRINNRKDLK